ncbi:bifunctional folylpolyglutamate synthase/dihydrofolate synthase [Isachenkonia alkalipeptolytica]|uniref:tetrahydrofolate synthase n=1 Tax=Isachenkonia alkalipeptolytica TaxID=2565777 RepID=A0AA44BCI6_9CLOT|nr:folylpolyglutamate synthase/dihydrofolate synthase family protein [Isachenkonia alkalipeptolytica]NBG86953.1 bifunctional folylpolyglutamate synthase/dihydrofolate synthase [Isachenkonia alkalipeptolytica]
MNYQEALNYIHGTYKFGKKIGLTNIRELLHRLGNPEKELKIIHVAGTNGKGSVSSFIHGGLKAAGYQVGLFTSPYLETFRERMQINGEKISEEHLVRSTEKVKEKIQEMVQEGKHHPSEFEVVTAIALDYFHRQSVDFLVLEVGLGGRFDATNGVERPILSIITNIGYDHTEYLGDTLAKIAYEKAGIIKEKIPVILYPQEQEAMEQIREIANAKEAPILPVDFSSLILEGASLGEQHFSIKVGRQEYNALSIRLLGSYQIYNSITALTALEYLKSTGQVSYDPSMIREGFYHTRWPGRFEILRKKPLTIIDGAHNPQAAKALTETLKQHLPKASITFVIGMLLDKDIQSFLEEIAPLGARFVLTKPFGPRAAEAEDLQEMLRAYEKPMYPEPRVSEAIDKAYAITGEEEVIVLVGSLYMIGEARTYIRKNYSDVHSI